MLEILLTDVRHGFRRRHAVRSSVAKALMIGSRDPIHHPRQCPGCAGHFLFDNLAHRITQLSVNRNPFREIAPAAGAGILAACPKLWFGTGKSRSGPSRASASLSALGMCPAATRASMAGSADCATGPSTHSPRLAACAASRLRVRTAFFLGEGPTPSFDQDAREDRHGRRTSIRLSRDQAGRPIAAIRIIEQSYFVVRRRGEYPRRQGCIKAAPIWRTPVSWSSG